MVADLSAVQDMPTIEYWNIAGSDNPSVPSRMVKHRVPGLEPHVWDSASWSDFKVFKEHHNDFLSGFNGFVAAHPSSFAALFEGFHKPVLINISTRYEHPFSTDSVAWELLDESLLALSEDGLLFPVANNVGDQEYFTSQTGIPCEYAPSLCGYVGKSAPRVKSGWAIFSNNPWLTKYTEEKTRGRWVDRKTLLPGHYSWSDLAALEGAFVVPYNSSTMTVFELASLGVSMVIPSLEFLKKLEFQFGYGIMDQVSFGKIRGKKLPKGRTAYLQGLTEVEWWFERSDFLMSPLVSQYVTMVDSMDELRDAMLAQPSSEDITTAYATTRSLRDRAYSKFIANVNREDRNAVHR